MKKLIFEIFLLITNEESSFSQAKAITPSIES